MEGQDSNSLGISGEIIASGTSTVDKPSGTHDQDENNVKRERDSPQVSQSESQLRNPCQDVVEISSDDELQIIDVNKEQNNSKAPAHGKGQKQQSAQSSAGRTSPKDVTCSVCLSEYDNKAFLDKCFRILLQTNNSNLLVNIYVPVNVEPQKVRGEREGGILCIFSCMCTGLPWVPGDFLCVQWRA